MVTRSMVRRIRRPLGAVKRKTLGLAYRVQIALDRRPSYEINQGQISHTYQESGLYGEYINACRVDAWRYALAHFPINTEQIIDVGCSYGSWADNWRELGFKRLCGLDPNPDVIETAKAVFDEAHLADASQVAALYPKAATVAANGVVIHLLKDDELVEFLADICRAIRPHGTFLYSVVSPEAYGLPRGGMISKSARSRARRLESHRRIACKAGLRIVGEVGTFVNPEPFPEADETFLAGLYDLYTDLAWDKRSAVPDPYWGDFAEVLLVTQPC